MGWFDERFTESAARHRCACEVCGRAMWLPASKAGKYRTCGRDCNAQARQRVKDDRSKTCETCGERFTPRTTQLARGCGRFCSQACNTAGRDALQTPDVQARARIGWKAAYAAAPWGKKGAAHPRWMGGRAAAIARSRPRIAAYKRQNPDRVRVWAANRRKRGAGYVAVAVVQELFALQRGRCAVCRCRLPKGYHLDHIEPVARGGGNERHNLQLLCPPCNTHKGAKEPLAFLQARGFLL